MSSSPFGFAARAGRWSARHRKTAILGWLAFVILALALGSATGKNTLTTSQAAVGESGHAARAAAAEFPESAKENVLIHSSRLAAGTPAFDAAIRDVARRLKATDNVSNVRHGPVSADRHVLA